MKTIPVTTRIEPMTLVLLRDCLIKMGFPAENLANNAQITKTALICSLSHLKKVTKITTPTEESLAILDRKPKLRKTSDWSF